MSADIIRFGNFVRATVGDVPVPRIVPIRAGDNAIEERERRNREWDIAEARTRFYKALYALTLAAQSAQRRGVDIPGAVQLLFASEQEATNSRVAAMEEAGKAVVRQLQTPVAWSGQLNWKRQFLRNMDCFLSLPEVRALIEADEKFLKTCPRNSGGYRRSRAELYGDSQ